MIKAQLKQTPAADGDDDIEEDNTCECGEEEPAEVDQEEEATMLQHVAIFFQNLFQPCFNYS